MMYPWLGFTLTHLPVLSLLIETPYLIRNSYKLTHLRWEVAQWLQHSPGRHEDLSVIPRTHLRKAGMMGHACNLSSEETPQARTAWSSCQVPGQWKTQEGNRKLDMAYGMISEAEL